ncbi:methyltransferase [Photorhabdus laumondii subsp. laumondii]|uniref:Photorhabdus luminescens subsp. laumondii TTO1 complete genome segment 17/17 n=3 Tax=Photorhabdus laumondii subsp. laumondii TaxID=141679 RepID=Q7MY06_PHOLL|nr:MULTISPECIES: methyltransferase [Photorhabdus]AWK44377.1 methyltransferase [Photorhabdus laumondii subsp. laumondii]AXG49689.1 methyltransferase [Photorhabdus laumondii subsp. laumondii]KTL62124.1 methyltransferase [Photorhabdus laumondii subsp. laumondii]MCC8383447.1 methyltransferase [Photorhabdus laumondii]MCC8411518.1 methyltransferase [Photorhabdus laumondii]
MLAELITSYRKSIAIYTFVDTGLSVHFKNGTYMDINELASQYGIDYSRLNRLCDFLIEIGVLVSSNDRVALSEECRVLADPESMESLIAKWEFNSGLWNAWLMYPKSLLENNGKSAFEIANGKPFFEYLDSNKLLKSKFDSLMSKDSDKMIEKLFNVYDFNQHDKILDVGGGEGNLLIRMSEKVKEKHYAVLDRYNELPDYGNINFIDGDFFKSIPSGYDLYILKNVIHDWPDNDAILILENCRKAMGNNATILLITLMKKPQSNIIKYFDILMDVSSLGKERDLTEFEYLANQAGLVIQDVKDIDESYSIIQLGVK